MSAINVNVIADIEVAVAAAEQPLNVTVTEEQFNVTLGETGPQGPSGPTGPSGVASYWYSGDGAPSSGLGDEDDFYLDNLNGDTYKKTGGVWVLDGNIQGPGFDGNTTIDGGFF